jgi:hypothetical protein
MTSLDSVHAIVSPNVVITILVSISWEYFYPGDFYIPLLTWKLMDERRSWLRSQSGRSSVNRISE